MTREVRVASPGQSIRDVAKMMDECDAGSMPVGDNDRLVGMITDRDIAIKGVACGMGPDAKIRDVMTADVKYCFEDQDLAEVTKNMADIQVRRLPVLDHDKRLVGIISLGDIAVNTKGKNKADGAGQALRGISRPGGQHSQTA
jgi:CBS domain-containing protein